MLVVYVLKELFGDYEVLGVYSDEKQAKFRRKIAMRELKNTTIYDFGIEEFTLNE